MLFSFVVAATIALESELSVIPVALPALIIILIMSRCVGFKSLSIVNFAWLAVRGKIVLVASSTYHPLPPPVNVLLLTSISFKFAGVGYCTNIVPIKLSKSVVALMLLFLITPSLNSKL